MKIPSNNLKIISVTADNVDEVGIFCIKNRKAQGYKEKLNWFTTELKNGLQIKIATDNDGKQLGFIEYIPAENAWRPVNADNYYFIQCIVVFAKDMRGKNIASELIQLCEEEAREENKRGVCVMSSKGPWIANRSVFEKNGFAEVDRKDRFELLAKKFDHNAPDPELMDWTSKQKEYQGWNLVYAHQCPWHDKSVTDLQGAANELGIDLKVSKFTRPWDAQNGPSGYGTFGLLKDGKLLEDHYLSKTRFKTIVRNQLNG